jgi:hypothetical protein
MNKIAMKLVADGHLTKERALEIEKRAEQLADQVAQNPKLLGEALQKTGGAFGNFFSKAKTYMADKGPEMAGAALLSMLAGGVGSAAESAVEHARDKVRKTKNFTEMMAANPHLADMDTAQVQRAFNTLHTFNPAYASDPFVAGEFVKQTLGQESFNLGGLGAIVKARKDLGDATRGGSTFGPEFFKDFAKGRPYDPEEYAFEAKRRGWTEADRGKEVAHQDELRRSALDKAMFERDRSESEAGQADVEWRRQQEELEQLKAENEALNAVEYVGGKIR